MILDQTEFRPQFHHHVESLAYVVVDHALRIAHKGDMSSVINAEATGLLKGWDATGTSAALKQTLCGTSSRPRKLQALFRAGWKGDYILLLVDVLAAHCGLAFVLDGYDFEDEDRDCAAKDKQLLVSDLDELLALLREPRDDSKLKDFAARLEKAARRALLAAFRAQEDAALP